MEGREEYPPSFFVTKAKNRMKKRFVSSALTCGSFWIPAIVLPFRDGMQLAQRGGNIAKNDAGTAFLVGQQGRITELFGGTEE